MLAFVLIKVAHRDLFSDVSGNGIYNLSWWILEPDLRADDESWAESVYSKANVCSCLLARNRSLQTASHIFDCVFTWLGRNIGIPDADPIQSSETEQEFDGTQEKNPIFKFQTSHPSEFPSNEGTLAFILQWVLMPVVSQWSPPNHSQLLLLIIPHLCINFKVFRTVAEPWNMSCFSYYSSNLFNNAFLCWLPWNTLTFQYTTIQYNIIESSPPKPLEESWCLVQYN